MSELNNVLKSLIPSQSGEKRSATSSLFSSFFGYGGSAASQVSAAGALTIPAYYNAVNQIANDIAKLPKGVYKKDGDKRTDVSHPIKFIINKEASPIMDAFTFHFVMMLAAMHRGNGVAYINRNASTGAILSLDFIHPDDLRDIRITDNKLYYYTKQGVLFQDEVIHIMGFTDNGYYGKGLIQFASETLGIAKATQSFTASNFENRGLGFGVVETEKQMVPTAKQEIEGSINSKLTADGKVKTVMLDEGMKYKPITLNMQEAQLIEQGKFSVLDIARFFNISPRKLKDFSINNYASAYQDSTDHVTDTIQPWSKKFEQEYDRKLFTSSEKLDHYIKLNDNYLLRGDLSAKGVFYNQAIFSGWMTRNEVRAMEEMNGLEGLSDPLQPVQLQSQSQIKNSTEDGK